MTTLEIVHSGTEEDIFALLASLDTQLGHLTDFTHTHKTRLVKPMISYDTSAFALSFLPAGDEFSNSLDSSYTFHHLRRDLYNVCKEAGVAVAPRYVVPSAHITIGRFLLQREFQTTINGKMAIDRAKVMSWLELIDTINMWLQEKYWPRDGGNSPEAGQWTVGSEQGLECRGGTCWYGGGYCVRIGKGSS